MNAQFLAGLIGPFSMSQPPTYVGLYAVNTGTAEEPKLEMWHWSGNAWLDSDTDDGLAIACDTNAAVGWFGQMEPGGQQAEEVDDGLGL